VGSIMTSRGCPYNCSFCYKAVFGNRFRARTAENVAQEWVELVEKYKVKEIAIVDDSFTTDVSRVHKICDYIIKEKIKVRWSCPNGIRVDLGDLEMLKKMRKAGCYRTALGLESGSQKILDTIGKKITLAKMEEMIKNCRNAGIKTMGFYMLGNIGETRETMQETINFARRVGTDYAQFLIAIPYPGTALYDEIKKNGKIYITDWDQYGQYEGSACFEHGVLNPALLTEMSKKAEKEYYFDPKYIMKQLVNPETYLFLPRRIKAVLRLAK
jgi:anaerobic magnesium-protoporphyrin IX monomethyl ester cyclase